MRLTRRQIFYVAVTAATLTLFGFVAQRCWIFWENQRVEEWVQSYGGIVDWDPLNGSGFRTPKWLEQLLGEPILDEITIVTVDGSPSISIGQVASLGRLRRLSHLSLNATPVSDDHVKVLSKSHSIKELDLRDTAISDTAIEFIANSMPQLETVYLSNTAITGEGLKSLSMLPHLRSLFLDGTQISDRDLKHLRHVQLTTLVVGEGVSDDGIHEIINLGHLKFVNFIGSPITDSGIDELIASLPNLERMILEETGVSREKLADLWKSGILRFRP